jgi:hypothetical protein
MEMSEDQERIILELRGQVHSAFMQVVVFVYVRSMKWKGYLRFRSNTPDCNYNRGKRFYRINS